jgi:Rap1a immunity proteins
MRNGMRTAIAALATLAMSTSAYAQKAEHYQIRHTADLVTVCSTAPSAPDYATAIAFCHGILAGAWGYYVASTAPLDREICSSDTTLTRAKVANSFVAWAKARPQYMQSGAVDTLFRFAAEAYPCKR